MDYEIPNSTDGSAGPSQSFDLAASGSDLAAQTTTTTSRETSPSGIRDDVDMTRDNGASTPSEQGEEQPQEQTTAQAQQQQQARALTQEQNQERELGRGQSQEIESQTERERAWALEMERDESKGRDGDQEHELEPEEEIEREPAREPTKEKGKEIGQAEQGEGDAGDDVDMSEASEGQVSRENTSTKRKVHWPGELDAEGSIDTGEAERGVEEPLEEIAVNSEVDEAEGTLPELSFRPAAPETWTELPGLAPRRSARQAAILPKPPIVSQGRAKASKRKRGGGGGADIKLGDDADTMPGGGADTTGSGTAEDPIDLEGLVTDFFSDPYEVSQQLEHRVPAKRLGLKFDFVKVRSLIHIPFVHTF